MKNEQLVKVLQATQWEEAKAAGVFSGCGIDLTDGFIHLSRRSQAVDTVRLYFAGQDGLLLVFVDAAALGDSLRWEGSRDGALFPHVYGEIPLEAVTAVEPLVLGSDGVHVFPPSFHND